MVPVVLVCVLVFFKIMSGGASMVFTVVNEVYGESEKITEEIGIEDITIETIQVQRMVFKNTDTFKVNVLLEDGNIELLNNPSVKKGSENVYTKYYIEYDNIEGKKLQDTVLILEDEKYREYVNNYVKTTGKEPNIVKE